MSELLLFIEYIRMNVFLNWYVIFFMVGNWYVFVVFRICKKVLIFFFSCIGFLYKFFMVGLWYFVKVLLIKCDIRDVLLMLFVLSIIMLKMFFGRGSVFIELCYFLFIFFIWFFMFKGMMVYDL